MGVPRRSGTSTFLGRWLPDHVTLGLLEAYLPDGEFEELVEDFGCAEERRRLLPAAMTVRLVMAMTLVPDGPVPEAICRAARLLAYLPWARPWHVPGTEAVTRRRDMIPAELFEALFWLAPGRSPIRGSRGCGGGGCCCAPGRVPGPGPGHPREPGVLRLLGHR